MVLGTTKKQAVEKQVVVEEYHTRGRRRELIGGVIGLLFGALAWCVGTAANWLGVRDAVTLAVFLLWMAAAAPVLWALAHGKWRRSQLAEQRVLYRGPGWATRRDFRQRIGSRGVKRFRQVRPSLPRQLGQWRRPTEWGLYLGRNLAGRIYVLGKRVFASFERCLLLVGTQGSGKTSLMIQWIIEAPGAVLTASTKPDIYNETHALRALLGTINVFNPLNIGGIASTLRWNPLSGCENYQVATDRASDLVHGTKAISGMQEASWGEKCVEIVAKYLMAAALTPGMTMHNVAAWLANPGDQQAVGILLEHADRVPAGWALSLQAEMESPAERMKGSIWSLARAAVAFMSNPVVAQACTPADETPFDTFAFGASKGTLYLLGDDNDETIAPLLRAFTTAVYTDLKASAGFMKANRHEPAALIALDEVAKIVPVDLAGWAADARGFGIMVVAIIQSYDQLRARWGIDGANEILSLYSRLVFGGSLRPTDLKDLSEKIGTRHVSSVSTGESEGDKHKTTSTSRSMKKEQTMAADVIDGLPFGHMLVLLAQSKAVVVKVRSGYKYAAKQRVARLKAHVAGLSQTPTAPAGAPTTSDKRDHVEAA